MRILLIGRTGQLGGDLLREPQEHEIVAPPREKVDIEHPESVAAALREVRPDVLINTAAFHNVPMCEQQPERAFRINCVAVRDLAELCARENVKLVTFSSDYVFTGDKNSPYRETDCPGPVQIYGISRLAGEAAALASAPGHAWVIRTCGLYGVSGAGSKGGNFVDKVVGLARSTPAINMSSDQTVSPTYTADLSRAVLAMLRTQAAPGLYHLVNEGACTWNDFSLEIVRLLGSAATVRPVDLRGRSGQMRRPLYSALHCGKAAALGVTMRPWREALGEYMSRKYGTTESVS